MQPTTSPVGALQQSDKAANSGLFCLSSQSVGSSPCTPKASCPLSSLQMYKNMYKYEHTTSGGLQSQVAAEVQEQHTKTQVDPCQVAAEVQERTRKLRWTLHCWQGDRGFGLGPPPQAGTSAQLKAPPSCWAGPSWREAGCSPQRRRMSSVKTETFHCSPLRLADNCTGLQGFMVFNAVGGGTGSEPWEGGGLTSTRGTAR